MKKYLLIAFLLVSLSCFSQSMKGNFSLPLTEKYVVLKFDCSETVFEKKYNESDWCLINGTEEWEKAKQEALSRIVGMMNEKMKDTRIIMVLENPSSSGSPDYKTNYTMYITPQSLDRKGKNKSQFVLMENATRRILGYAKTSGGGGHFGSLGNLLGDGYEDCAPDVGKIIAKHNKRKKGKDIIMKNPPQLNETNTSEEIDYDKLIMDKITHTPCYATLILENNKEVKTCIISVNERTKQIIYRIVLEESNEPVGHSLSIRAKKVKDIKISE